ncbi:3-hydroxyacyl-CoA dehydrogenase/enoyl-CoA hydratase family protein [Thermus thermophilus]|uniref:3-hydroxyacyl-CoA dehydrogenase/enoyl-CoA hydratase family protein n=1 Tax=Thermus thermophilus TaxID=274 RepID=UPI0030E118FB
MIKKVGVVGAGTMGSGIAALVASAGIPVVLLDIPGKEDRNEYAKRGLERALKARPAAFMDPERARYVEIGNTEDDLEKLKDCDWVVEAIIEKPEPKQALYARLEGLLKPTAIVSSNTSGIPMRILLEGRSEGFRRRFLGTHFFNPPRYLHLLELIPTPETDPKVLEEIRRFGERILGKGTVLAKDSPGFIANRLGVYGMVQAVRLMEKHGLTIDEVDALTGPLLGRPNSATFRTADLTGLDVLKLVTEELAQATGEDFALPEWVHRLVEEGRLGEKAGAGFYKRVNGEIYTLDYRTLDYAPRTKLELPELRALRDLPLRERLAKALDLPGKYGAFLRELFAKTAHYTLEKAPEIAYDLVSVDQALEWGFGWEEGPFKNMDAVGLSRVEALFAEHGLEAPELLRRAQGTFYKDGAYLGFDGAYHPLPKREGVISLKALKSEGKTLLESKEAVLLDLGDGVALLEFRTKMNAIGEGVIRMLQKSLEFVEEKGYLGLVIGNEDPRAFSAGANLALILSLAQEGDWDELALAVRQFQKASMSLRYSPFPVVVAPFGLTLGGGAEFTLHADRVQAHAELYMGLVEAGVGLLPAGGGTKEMLLRFTQELAPYEEADPFEAVKRAFQLIAMARTSTSALEARKMGFLRDGDGISMNRDFLIADAKRRVLELAPDYRPPLPPRVRVLGSEALGNLRYAVWAFREAGEITDHDVRIGLEIAYVLSGGEGPAREVSEWDLLDLEREAFLKLLGTRKTQERIAYTLKTGKPLRN